MKFMAIFFLAALAMGGAEECTEDDVASCVENILVALMDDDITEEGACRELRKTADCLRETVDRCLEDVDEEVEKGLQELENSLMEHCEAGAEKRSLKKRSEYPEPAMGAAEECTGEEVESCVDDLLIALTDEDLTEEEACRKLRETADCLRETVDRCLEDVDDEVEESLQELEKSLMRHCKAGTERRSLQRRSEDTESDENDDNEDKEIEQCLEDNEEYLYECIFEGSYKALTVLVENEITDKNIMQCAMYAMMAGCFVEIIEERCGAEAAKAAEEEMGDFPNEIQEACEAADVVELARIELLDKKKRK